MNALSEEAGGGVGYVGVFHLLGDYSKHILAHNISLPICFLEDY
jgi:hypothetical protein